MQIEDIKEYSVSDLKDKKLLVKSQTLPLQQRAFLCWFKTFSNP